MRYVLSVMNLTKFPEIGIKSEAVTEKTILFQSHNTYLLYCTYCSLHPGIG